MSRIKRWLSFALTLTLLAGLALPSGAAFTAEQYPALLIEAENADAPEVTLHVVLYRRDETGGFQPDDEVRYACQINRAAGDASFHIQPKTDGVWVTVDYLTDLDQDGVYEMLDGEDSPAYDSMTTDNQLVKWSGTAQTLTAGETYSLSAQTLTSRGEAALSTRSTLGSDLYLGNTAGALPDLDSLLYLITLHCSDPADGTVYELCYYVKVYDRAIVPSDVPCSASYYDAVEFAIERGFLSGTGEDTFSPDLALTRSQLAQILWRLEASPSAPDGGFLDVAAADWFYSSVSWCKESGLMTGVEEGYFGPNIPLSREQLALILMQYTRHVGEKVSGAQELSAYSDAASVSSWARDGMEWAVGNGLLGVGVSQLNPGGGVTRAELAVILQTYCESILDS